MIKVNENYVKLPGDYLFAEIARRTAAFTAENPDRTLIKLGIGDVTRPLAPAVVEAMKKPRGYGVVRDLLRLRSLRGLRISP
jgi:LL-diaminopimelate aminotransferase